MRYAAIYVLAVSGGNYAVRWALSRVPDAARVNVGMAQAGRWIGYLERLMILTMILGGSYSAVGFVFAGKAIARFREQKQTEVLPAGHLRQLCLGGSAGLPGQRQDLDFSCLSS